MKDILESGRIGLDTALFIYFIEENAEWAPLVTPIFEAIDRGDCEAATSELTLLETLVAPYRAGNEALAQSYETILTRSRGLTLMPVDRRALRSAALLRAQLGFKTADALRVAAAMAANCTVFITNDRRLPSLTRPRIVQLSDLALDRP